MALPIHLHPQEQMTAEQAVESPEIRLEMTTLIFSYNYFTAYTAFILYRDG